MASAVDLKPQNIAVSAAYWASDTVVVRGGFLHISANVRGDKSDP
jgi:hypothetical protein